MNRDPRDAKPGDPDYDHQKYGNDCRPSARPRSKINPLEPDAVAKAVERILHPETEFWLPTIKSETLYSRLHDDHDGKFDGFLGVQIDRMGDAFILPHMETLRFRTYHGGGMSLRVRKALVVLAEAIRLDNEYNSQRKYE